MRDIREVLKEKERQLEGVRKEVEALRLVAPLLHGQGDVLKKAADIEQIVWKDATTGRPVKACP